MTDKPLLLDHAPFPWQLGMVNPDEVYTCTTKKRPVTVYYVIDAAGLVEDPDLDGDELIIFRVFRSFPANWITAVRRTLSVRNWTKNVYTEEGCDNCTYATWRHYCAAGYINTLDGLTDEQLVKEGFRRVP